MCKLLLVDDEKLIRDGIERMIDWTGLGGKPISLYHMPNWPNEETLVPVFAKRQPEEP